MTVEQLINALSKHDKSLSVVVFAEGELWNVLAVQVFENTLELGCGWEPVR